MPKGPFVLVLFCLVLTFPSAHICSSVYLPQGPFALVPKLFQRLFPLVPYCPNYPQVHYLYPYLNILAQCPNCFKAPVLRAVERGQGVQSTGARHVLRGPAAIMLEKLSYVTMYSIFPLAGNKKVDMQFGQTKRNRKTKIFLFCSPLDFEWKIGHLRT